MVITDKYSPVILRYQDGLTPGGSPIIRKKILNNVKPGTSLTDLYEIATALFSLTECSLLDVHFQVKIDCCINSIH